MVALVLESLTDILARQVGAVVFLIAVAIARGIMARASGQWR